MLTVHKFSDFHLDQDLEQDIFLGSADLGNLATVTWYGAPLAAAGSDFTFGFWFRFLQKDGTGNILTVYAQE